MQEKNSAKVKIILNVLANIANTKDIKGLAIYLGQSSTKLYGWIRNGSIADKKIILTKFPNINKDWLSTGEGEPFPEKIAATIQPGDEEKRQKMIRKSLQRKLGKERPEGEAAQDTELNEDAMLEMTSRVLRSDTVYRSALASNVRAFYQAVVNEEEMASVKEELQKMREEHRSEMGELKEMLLSMGASLPKKREQGNG